MTRNTITHYVTRIMLKYLAIVLITVIAWRDGDRPKSRPEYMQEVSP